MQTPFGPSGSTEVGTRCCPAAPHRPSCNTVSGSGSRCIQTRRIGQNWARIEFDEAAVEGHVGRRLLQERESFQYLGWLSKEGSSASLRSYIPKPCPLPPPTPPTIQLTTYHNHALSNLNCCESPPGSFAAMRFYSQSFLYE